MPPSIPAVVPSSAGVYRISRRPQDPFDPAAWHHSGKERFDDPGPDEPEGSPLSEGSYRVLYCATDRVTAFRECIAHFRPSLTFLRELGPLAGDDDYANQSLHGALDVHDSAVRGIVTRDWRQSRHIGQAKFDGNLCADFADPACWTHMSSIPQLTDSAQQAGISDIDLSAVTSAARSFTQACARFVYEQVDDNGYARFSGIRY